MKTEKEDLEARGPGYYGLAVYVAVYFFFNSLLLPEGLLYTTILTPLMLYYLYRNRHDSPSSLWLILLLIPLPFQLINGPDLRSWTISLALVITSLVFLWTAVVLVKRNRKAMPDLFRGVLLMNGILVTIALLMLPFPALREWTWYTVPLTAGLENLPRLRMFTYEPSWYALVMMPVFLYFILRVLHGYERNPLLVAALVIAPLLFSFSFGMLGALLIGLLVTTMVFLRRIPRSWQKIFLYTVLTALPFLAALFLLWPENPAGLRISNILEGKDTSAMGRLVYSFRFAWDLAVSHNPLFGVGPGQVKLLAHDLIVNHYRYQGTMAETVRIPNAIAETVATFGIYGLLTKIVLEIWLFARKKLWTNTFHFSLFILLFIYQFTGSYIGNVAELGGWVLAFSMCFPEFSIKPVIKTREAGP